jgi:thiol-disulfide isomerase/thioredoxin
MMRASLTLTSVLLVLAGCNPATTPTDAGISVGQDAGGNVEVCGDPGAPYGTSQGSNFLPLTLPSCDGTPYEFYGADEGFCEARFTVLSMAAGWCGPCRAEATLMQDLLVDAYADQGVRVIVAIIEDNGGLPADGAFCEGWVDQYSLTNPVLYDRLAETQIYFPAGALPATVIVDSQGVIRHREYGVSAGLETVRAALDRLLAE